MDDHGHSQRIRASGYQQVSEYDEAGYLKEAR